MLTSSNSNALPWEKKVNLGFGGMPRHNVDNLLKSLRCCCDDYVFYYVDV